jgi:diaminohydroxyphosphoribosylaminopyrimidine deaminase / 5-amino-6-(5-phosphoribosylamino)uracil reductase
MIAKDQYMLRALQLAGLGAGMVSPNPMVGAVLVYQDRVIGEGWHERYGGPHAEVNCLRNVADADRIYIRESTLYVTLEPCHHHGKTPPCVDLVLREKIPHVVIAHTDPNPLTAGRSVARLRAAGVQLEVGMCVEAAQALNRTFIHWITTGKPYVILKWAQTPDQKMGSTTSGRLQISTPITQRLVHQWRSQTDAILVGKRTAQIDDPRLDLRYATVQKPYLRIVLCSAADLSADVHLLDDSQPTWLFGSELGDRGWEQTENLPKAEMEIESLLTRLAAHQKAILFVEGGGDTIGRFVESGHWNEIRRITGTTTYPNADVLAPDLPTAARLIERFTLSSDTIEVFRHEK